MIWLCRGWFPLSANVRESYDWLKKAHVTHLFRLAKPNFDPVEHRRAEDAVGTEGDVH